MGFSLGCELNIAKSAALKAADSIMAHYKDTYHVGYKADHTPVTLADEQSNEVIKTLITQAFPEYGFLSEEGGDDFKRLKKEWTWIVDPLDGTKEFIKQTDDFSICIGLCYKAKPVLGVIYAPVYKKMYYAVLGQGAYLEKAGTKKRLKVSERRDHLKCVCGNRSYTKEFLQMMHAQDVFDIKIVGSALKGCMVAEGSADLYYQYGMTSQWDTCAMEVIVTEAGGLVRQLDHTPIVYNKKKSLNEKGFYVVNHIENLITGGFYELRK